MRKSAIYFGAGLLLVLLLWVVFHQSQKQETTPKSVDAKSQPAKHGTASLPKDSTKDLEKEEDEEALHSPDPILKAELQTLKSLLAQKLDRETVLRLLQEFTQKTFSSNPDTAAAALLEFLQSGQDEATGLDFIVGEAGLEEWPSLRAFVMDLLGKIDLGIASQYVLKNVIPVKNSTSEYAISLRILWDSGGAEEVRPELAEAWLGLLQKPDWADQPDAAWMESMDFAGRIPTALPLFVALATGWLADPEHATGKAEAAQLALERAARNHPVETMATLLENPDWLSQGRGPGIRGSLFARANLADPAQAKMLQRYLSTLDPASRQAVAFAKAFPYRKFSASPGLSGLPDLQTPEEIRTSNRAAAEFFRQALLAGRYPGLKDKITQIQARLNELNRVK